MRTAGCNRGPCNLHALEQHTYTSSRPIGLAQTAARVWPNRVRLVANDMAFWFYIGFLNTKRPSLPRITRPIRQQPKSDETTSKAHLKPVWMGILPAVTIVLQSFSILVASVLVQGGIATNTVDRPLRYNQRRSWLPIIVFCTKNAGYFLVVRSP